MKNVKKMALVALGLALLGSALPGPAKAEDGCDWWNLGCMWYYIATGTYYSPSTPAALTSAQKAASGQ